VSGQDAAPAWLEELRAAILGARFADAERLIEQRRATDPAPQSFELALRQRWGMTLSEAGDLEGAETQLRAAAALAPDDAETQNDLAVAELRRGRHAQAVGTLRRVLELDPGHKGALANLGAALMALKQHAAAEEIYRRLLAQDPGDAAAQRNLGVLLNALERHEEALAVADAALAAGPSATALGVRAAALFALDRFDESIAASRLALQAGDDPYEHLCRLGLALASSDRLQEAFAVLDQAVALRPASHLAYHRRSLIRLKAGEFEGGWRDHEARWRDEPFLTNAAGGAARALAPRFRLDVTLDQLRDRSVLVVGEQGIGDEIMFASMLPDLSMVAGRVTCLCDARLVRLFRASMPAISFRPAHDAGAVEHHDVVLPAGSLGRLFRNRLADFRGAPYLRPSPAVAARWDERLGARPQRGLRVGLSWRGGTKHTRLSQRSVPLDDLLTALPRGNSYVSLQYGDVRADLAAAGAGDVQVFDPAEISDFEDLAGLVSGLDAVVSVQTAVVHLAGALGTPCLTLVPHIAEWRYMAEGETMPWYGSVRLFRQPRRGAWAPVLEAAGAALGRMAPQP